MLLKNKPIDIYSFTNYKDIVMELIKDETGVVPRGGYRDLAEVLRCNPSFISHFFRKEIHFTIDHAYRFCQSVSMTREETLFFMELLLLQKAADFKTKEFFTESIEQMRASKLVSA